MRKHGSGPASGEVQDRPALAQLVLEHPPFGLRRECQSMMSRRVFGLSFLFTERLCT